MKMSVNTTTEKTRKTAKKNIGTTTAIISDGFTKSPMDKNIPNCIGHASPS
jgi:hypothetical protein